MFPHRSGSPSASHVDHGLDVVNSDHPVYDVVHALMDGAVPLHEARVAMMMALGEEPKGFRHIEQASGLTDDSLLKVIPEAGSSTTLLRCANRGKFAYDETERQQINLSLRRYRSSAGHPSGNSKSLSVSQSFSLGDLEEEEREDLGKSGVRQMSLLLDKSVLDLLDPSLDLWQNASEGSAGRQEFGDTGWALAVVTRMKATVLSVADLCRILRLGDRQVRRVVDKLAQYGWAKRVRQGRQVLVEIDFSAMADEDARLDYLKHARRARKSLVAQREQGVVKRMATRTGRMIRDLWRNRINEARMLQDWAEMLGDRCWDSMISILRKEGRWRALTRWEAEHALWEDLRPYLREEETLTA